MRTRLQLCFAGFLLGATMTLPIPARSQDLPSAARPPVARSVPRADTLHGDVRVDPYSWIRDDSRQDPEVLDYLKAENAYTSAVMKPTEGLQATLFEEIKRRTREDDQSAPVRYHDYWYYTRNEVGKPYRIYCRRKGSLTGQEEVYLDQNRMAEASGSKFFELGDVSPSPDGRRVVYTVDTNGSEHYTGYILDLANMNLLPDRLENCQDLAWASDSRTLFYTVRDSADRAFQAYRHAVGSTLGDHLVFEERDPVYELSLATTLDEAYVLIQSSSSTSDEWQAVSSLRPGEEFRVLQPRQPDVQYSVAHHEGTWLIRTNFHAVNFRVMTAPVATPDQAHWQELLGGRDSVKISEVEAFEGFWVAQERESGLVRFRITDFKTGASHYIQFPEKDYSAAMSGNRTYRTGTFRYSFQSLNTPASWYDYDVKSRKASLVKRTEVLGGFDPAKYVVDRIHVRTYDGAEVPVSLCYRKDVKLDGSAPCLLYGYGAYGISMDPTFSIPRLALLDRGVVYALAHIRGGGELGEPWKLKGKFFYKRNTFTDFISCAEALVARKYTSNERLCIQGGSAGGMLIGAVVNMRPDLFHAAVAQVPFVDVLNTMLDASLPLTTGEYLEWGNPNDSSAYFYMRTYCPYTNVSAQRYPGMLVTTGLHDPRVGYWEGAKFVAKLRAMKLDDHEVLMRCNMGQGHLGASSRYDDWKERSFVNAYLLWQLGLSGSVVP